MAKRSRARRNYPAEYRARILDLVRAGRSPLELSREFEPTYGTIRKWMREEGLVGEDDPEANREDPQREVERLRREVEQLRIEREILKKAAAWFARETDTVPPKSSHS